MNNRYPKYSAVIRTLGTAGDKYVTLINSLKNQTVRPEKILVYLAEGYDKPERVADEEIVYVKKGMVAQRALPYKEVETEWMIFLDDDLAIESDGIQRLFEAALQYNADVVAYDPFPHHKIPLSRKFAMAVLLSSIPRIGQKKKGYTVNILGTDMYNNNPGTVAWSTTNAGAAFICKKQNFLKIHLEKDLWLDESPYAIPEDKVTFYKMHLAGLRILTHYNAGFTHLDAQSAATSDRALKTAYSAARNSYIFNQLYVRPNISKYKRPLALLGGLYCKLISSIYNYIKDITGDVNCRNERKRGLQDAKEFLRERAILKSKAN